jgi:4-hydroxybenzoate polyprenyltransferase
MSLNHTDSPSTSWINRQLPQWARPYVRLIRLDRPIGTWLLLLPCWWGVVLAGGRVPDLWLMFLFGIGAIVMRGAGCIVNDIYDREIDQLVERTQSRPLASGEVKVWQAVLFLALLLVIGFCVLMQFNRFTIVLGVASLALVFTYPLAKRVTWWPQLVLGLAFNWGALMGWSAVQGTLGLPALLLYAAGIFWTLGYDTIYARQDMRDDALAGVKSLALKLGDNARPWVAGFYTAALLILVAAGLAAGLGNSYYILLAIAAFHAIWQLAGWRMDDPANCLQRFRRNRDFGLIVLAAIMIGKIL